MRVKPIRGYHGTLSDVRNATELRESKDFGPHFSTSRGTAAAFAWDAKSGRVGRIIEADLYFSNPLDLPDSPDWYPTEVAKVLDELFPVPDGQPPLRRRVFQIIDSVRAAYYRTTAGVSEAEEKSFYDRTHEEKDLLRSAAKTAMQHANRAGFDLLRDWMLNAGYDAVRYVNQFEGTPADCYIALDMSKVAPPGTR